MRRSAKEMRALGRWFLLSAAVASLFLGAAAFADVLHGNDLNTGGDTQVAPGGAGTAAFYLTKTGSKDPCNANTSSPVTVTVSSNQSWLTIDSPGTVILTDCGITGEGTIGYSVSNLAPVGATAVISGVASGGIAESDGFNNNPGKFNVTVAPPPPPTDTTPPLISMTTAAGDDAAGTGWYNSSSSGTDGVRVNVSASDSSGVTSLACADGAVSVLDTSSAAVKDSGSFVLHDGIHSLSCTATDGAGNNGAAADSTPMPASLKIDQTGPSISGSASPGANAAGWNNSDVTVSFSCSDATSDIASCESAHVLGSDGADQSATGNATDKAGNAATTTVSGINIDETAPTSVSGAPTRDPDHGSWYNHDVHVAFSGDGGPSGIASCTAVDYSGPEGADKTVQGSCTDNAGNTSAAVPSSAFDYDDDAPTGVTGAPTRSPDEGSWYNHAVHVAFSGEGGASGIASCTAVDYSGPDGANQTVQGSCSDGAGNTSAAVASSSFDYDATGPINVSGAPDRPSDHGSWYNSPVDVVFTGEDGSSGIKSCTIVHYDGADGSSRTVEGSCTDEAGNSTAVASSPFDYDATAPTGVAGAPDRDPDHGGWYNHSVDIVFSGDGGPSGIESCTHTTYSSPDGASQTVPGSCTDGAGNTSTPVPSSAFDYDVTAPTGVAGGPDRDPDHGSWYNHTVRIAFSGDGGASGIASCTTIDYSGPDGSNQTVEGSCTDNAGNASAAVASSAFDYDDTGPELSPTVAPNPVELYATANATANATDSPGSGVAWESCDPVVTTSVGQKWVGCAAEDRAGNGNSARASYSVIYRWRGFFQPIDNKDASGSYILNVAKAGSAIPVKFSLSGNMGLSIFETGFPSSAPIACGQLATDAIEETATATTSGLKYDATADQYNYTWKTNSAWAGTCRQLVVKLSDGTYHRADFKFSK